MKNTLKWKRAGTIYPTDHLISSKAREVGAYGFKPTYLEGKHTSMYFLLSNEYMRLWFKDRDLYQKENYSKQEKDRNEADLKRGFVQRMMTNPKLEHRELPMIQLKRFQNIISRIDNGRSVEEKTKLCERYKKSLLPTELTRYKPACSNQKTKTNSANEKKNPGPKQKPNQNPNNNKNASKQSGNKPAPPQTQNDKGKNGSPTGQCVLLCDLPPEDNNNTGNASPSPKQSPKSSKSNET